jgi:hypothetical protein
MPLFGADEVAAADEPRDALDLAYDEARALAAKAEGSSPLTVVELARRLTRPGTGCRNSDVAPFA